MMFRFCLFFTLCALFSPLAALTAAQDDAVPDDSSYGYVRVPAVWGDAGFVSMQAGMSGTVEWREPPPDGVRYEMGWYDFRTKTDTVIGIDEDPSDGVTTEWTIPEDLYGVPYGIVTFADGSTFRQQDQYAEWGSGEGLPSDGCLLKGYGPPLPLLSQPLQASYDRMEKLGIGETFDFVRVLARTDDEGIYLVDTTGATPYVRGNRDADAQPDPLPTVAWADKNFGSGLLFGPCDDLPAITLPDME